MAAKSLKNTDYLISCPVCHDPYENPRLLPSCGHQFCLTCLGRLNNRTKGGCISITCPVCRTVSKCKEDDGISSLPRSVLMKEVQEMLQDYLKSCSPRNLLCDICEKPDLKATMLCVDCQDKMCDACFKEHEGASSLAKHQTFPACPELFCEHHDKLIINYCKTCSSGVCKICARKAKHESHEIGPVDVVADELRKRLDGRIKDLRERQAAEPSIAEWREKADTMATEYDRMIDTIDKTYRLLKSLITSLDQKRESLKYRRLSNHQKSSEYIKELEEASGELEKEMNGACDARNSGSDIEVIAKAAAVLSHWDLDYDPDPPTLLPVVFKRQVDTIVDAADCDSCEGGDTDTQMRSFLHATMETIQNDKSAKNRGLSSMFSDNRFTVPVAARNIRCPDNVLIWDVLFKGDPSEMVVRTNSVDCPISVYDSEGVFAYGLGKDCASLVEYGHLAYDSKRKVYLAPAAAAGSIHLIPADGSATSILRIPGQRTGLAGIAYLASQDLYVVANKLNSTGRFEKSRICVFDVRSNAIVNTYHPDQEVIALSAFIDDKNKEAIATCQEGVGKIGLYNLDDSTSPTRFKHDGDIGNGHGEGIGELCCPSYVTAASPGQLLVCDTGNKRLVCFKTSEEFSSDTVLDSTTWRYHLKIRAKQRVSVAVNAGERQFVLASGNRIDTYSFGKLNNSVK